MNVAIPSKAFEHAHEGTARLFDAAEEVERKTPFSESHVHDFIKDLSECPGDAEMWLQDQGIHKTCIATAELLRTLSRSFVKSPLSVYEVAGIDFYREMRKLAYEAWNTE